MVVVEVQRAEPRPGRDEAVAVLYARYRSGLVRLAVGLLESEMPVPKSVRLLGVSLSSLQTETKFEPQLVLPI